MAPQAVSGGLAAQLARRAGARVLGIASAGHADLLRAIGVEPVAYGDGLGDRLRSLARTGSTPSSMPTAAATSISPSH